MIQRLTCWLIAPEPHILLFKRKKEFTKMNPELIEKIKQEQQAKLNKELDKLDPQKVTVDSENGQ